MTPVFSSARINCLGCTVAAHGDLVRLYMLTVKKLRETCPPQEIMAWSGLFAVPLMFIAALASGETLLSSNFNGWAVLLGLAVVSHFAGQG